MALLLLLLLLQLLLPVLLHAADCSLNAPHDVQIPAGAIAAALKRLEDSDSDGDDGLDGVTEAGSVWGGDDVRVISRRYTLACMHTNTHKHTHLKAPHHMHCYPQPQWLDFNLFVSHMLYGAKVVSLVSAVYVCRLACRLMTSAQKTKQHSLRS